MQAYEQIETLVEDVKTYAKINYELVKLEGVESVSIIGSGLMCYFLVAFAAMLFGFFISLGIGFWLCTAIGDTYSGFLIIAGFYLFLSLGLFFTRKRWIERLIRNKIIRKMLTKN